MNEFYNSYQSPFSWRYGSTAMRAIWSELNKRKLWRNIWTAVARAQLAYGLTTQEQVAELESRQEDIDIDLALQIEKDVQHDVVAEIRVFASQCPQAGAIIHLGLTSMDVVDNADFLRCRQSLSIIIERLDVCLDRLQQLIEQTAHVPVMAYTHLQPAEPTTLGYRLAGFAQDLLAVRNELTGLMKSMRGKGFKGAVGTRAAFAELVGVDQAGQLDEQICGLLDMPAFSITTQTAPRLQDYQLMSCLAALAIPIYKFAFDLRILQSPLFGEMGEQFGAKQVGSSAMPFKRNPITAEKIDSLARLIAGMPRLAWDNAAHSLLERTLDDSANRRSALPESFLVADELLISLERILKGLRVDYPAIERNLATYGPFAALERVLMEASKAGGDRQLIHERLRELAMQAWETVQAGSDNPLFDLLQADDTIRQFVSVDKLSNLMDFRTHTGDAARRAGQIANDIGVTIHASK